MRTLGLDDTIAFFDKHYAHSAFRLETLDNYDVGSDGGDVARYLRGDPEPTVERKQAWLDELAAERRAGKVRSRVHVLTTPLTDYLRYECEWGYAPNALAGEEIRILDLSAVARPAGIIDEDFWLLDDDHVLRMIYDDGRFRGAIPAPDPAPFRLARDIAVSASEEFTTWWERHPAYWRANWATT